MNGWKTNLDRVSLKRFLLLGKQISNSNSILLSTILCVCSSLISTISIAMRVRLHLFLNPWNQMYQYVYAFAMHVIVPSTQFQPKRIRRLQMVSSNVLSFLSSITFTFEIVNCVWHPCSTPSKTHKPTHLSNIQYIFISIVSLVMVRYGNCDILVKLPKYFEKKNTHFVTILPYLHEISICVCVW